MSPFLNHHMFLLLWVSILWGVDKLGGNYGAMTFADLFAIIIIGIIVGIILQFLFSKS